MLHSRSHVTPVALRFPRDDARDRCGRRRRSELEVGTAEVLRKARAGVWATARSVGARRRGKLAEGEFEVGVVDARFAKPLDKGAARQWPRSTRRS